jgi:hypothetical protein
LGKRRDEADASPRCERDSYVAEFAGIQTAVCAASLAPKWAVCRDATPRRAISRGIARGARPKLPRWQARVLKANMGAAAHAQRVLPSAANLFKTKHLHN